MDEGLLAGPPWSSPIMPQVEDALCLIYPRHICGKGFFEDLSNSVDQCYGSVQPRLGIVVFPRFSQHDSPRCLPARWKETLFDYCTEKEGDMIT